MDEIRKTAKTVEEAIAAALAELGVSREETDITVIDEGSKAFLGMFGGKDAVVLVKKNFQPEREAESFLREIFLTMGLIVKIKAEMKDKHLFVELTGDDMGILIGKRGQTLDALQYLVALTCNRIDGEYYRITLDCGNYREKREATLKALASRIAAKVKKTGRSQLLEPMNPYERRIIHAVVSEIEGVTSKSKGEEPNRRVVILSEHPAKPYSKGGRDYGHGRKPLAPRKRERTMEEILKSDLDKSDFARKEESAELYSKLEL